MSKTRITKKAIKENYFHVVNVPYCGLQHLLRFYSPTYYTTRAEGWGLDVYEVGDVAICTGYDTISGVKNIPYDIYKKYDLEAMETINRTNDYKKTELELDALIDKFISEVIRNK